MKIAVTVWEGRISPVFDVSRQIVILTIERKVVIAIRTEGIEMATSAHKIDRLIELGVKTLICGAISEPLHRELTARGVRVLGFVAGALDEVMAILLAGSLPDAAFAMPGSCGRRNRSRGGQGRKLGNGCGG
jgi:predicted Fe-Mo cluster-binding NifX family protein